MKKLLVTFSLGLFLTINLLAQDVYTSKEQSYYIYSSTSKYPYNEEKKEYFVVKITIGTVSSMEVDFEYINHLEQSFTIKITDREMINGEGLEIELIDHLKYKSIWFDKEGDKIWLSYWNHNNRIFKIEGDL